MSSQLLMVDLRDGTLTPVNGFSEITSENTDIDVPDFKSTSGSVTLDGVHFYDGAIDAFFDSADDVRLFRLAFNKAFPFCATHRLIDAKRKFARKHGHRCRWR